MSYSNPLDYRIDKRRKKTWNFNLVALSSLECVERFVSVFSSSFAFGDAWYEIGPTEDADDELVRGKDRCSSVVLVGVAVVG